MILKYKFKHRSVTGVCDSFSNLGGYGCAYPCLSASCCVFLTMPVPLYCTFSPNSIYDCLD